MRKVILFIAMSLDGYIADSDGGVDWLGGEDAGANDMVSYQEFIKDIDTVIMGYNTYHQIVTELSPGEWFYKDFTSYVMTHREVASEENIKFVNEDICSLINKLKEGPGKDIWICGGAKIIHPLIQDDLIDRYHISIIPVLLGGGVRLFQKTDTAVKLKLVGSQSYNGITDVVYERR